MSLTVISSRCLIVTLYQYLHQYPIDTTRQTEREEKRKKEKGNEGKAGVSLSHKSYAKTKTERRKKKSDSGILSTKAENSRTHGVPLGIKYQKTKM